MKNLMRALTPTITLLLTSAAVAASMQVGYRHDDFTVTFDDCGGILEGISIGGAVYSSHDRLCYSFDLKAGESAPAALSDAMPGGDGIIYGVKGDDRRTYLRFFIEFSLPDDAVLSDRNVNYNAENRAIMPDNEHAYLYSDRIGYRFYLRGSSFSDYIPLGDIKILTADEIGDIRVELYPLISRYEDHIATYIFSSSAEDYHFSRLVYPDTFAEFTYDQYAWIEPVGDEFNVCYADLIANTVNLWTPDGKVEELCRLTPGRELLMLVGEGKKAAFAAADDEYIYLSLNDSEYRIGKDGAENFRVEADISNGAATFLIGMSRNGQYSLRYIALDESGLIADWKTEPINNDAALINIFQNYRSNSFDTYYDGERIYLLENHDYYVSSGANSFNPGDDMMYGKYGGGLIGYFVRLTVLDKNGVAAERLTPLNMNISRGEYGSYRVKLRIGGES